MTAAAAAAFPSCSAAVPDSKDRLGSLLPLRNLGSTGRRVTCLGLGGYHIGWTTEALAQATIEAALEEGVRFFDTAESYGPHSSEERYGRYLVPRARDLIFLMTKSTAPTGALAREHLEASLRRLKTDVVDLWQIHALASAEDVDARLDQGVLKMALKAKEEGKIRHIGFTGHASPYAHKRMLEKTAGIAEPFAACQFPLNPVDAVSAHSFLDKVLPLVRQRGLGMIAMKSLADGRFFGSKVEGGKKTWSTENPVVPQILDVKDCIHFALSLPVSVLVTGAENPDFLREKAALVRRFQMLGEQERKALADKVAAYAAAAEVEYYKAKECKG